MNHNLGDGSWTLTVFVTDLQVERSLRVRGDLHIGGVMIRLVDELGKTHCLKSIYKIPTHQYTASVALFLTNVQQSLSVRFQ